MPLPQRRPKKSELVSHADSIRGLFCPMRQSIDRLSKLPKQLEGVDAGIVAVAERDVVGVVADRPHTHNIKRSGFGRR